MPNPALSLPPVDLHWFLAAGAASHGWDDVVERCLAGVGRTGTAP